LLDKHLQRAAERIDSGVLSPTHRFGSWRPEIRSHLQGHARLLSSALLDQLPEPVQPSLQLGEPEPV
jgi:hypothetical protein